MTPEQTTLIFGWRDEARVAAKAHCQASVRAEKNNYLLGIPVVVLSTLVGTSVFVALQRQPTLALQIAVGLTSIAAATLASLQTFLRYAEGAAKHREASARFHELQEFLEQTAVLPPADKDTLERLLTDYRQRYQVLVLSSPNVPDVAWNSAVDFVASTPSRADQREKLDKKAETSPSSTRTSPEA